MPETALLNVTKHGSHVVACSLTVALRPVLAELFVYESEDGSRNADDYECGYGAPDGVGLGELPDREDAEYRAGDKRNRNHDKRDPADQLRVEHTPAFGLELDHDIGLFVCHAEIIPIGSDV